MQPRIEGLEGHPGFRLTELEDLRLRRVEQLLGAIGAVVALFDDLGRDADEPAFDRFVAHDSRVVQGVGRGRLVVEQLRQIDGSTHRIEKLFAIQVVGERVEINRLVVVLE